MFEGYYTALNQAFPYWVILVAYLIGSIPTGYLVGRILYKIDIRESGSGNAGATNTLRLLGTRAGITVLAIDILKGVAAILLAKSLHEYVHTINELNWIVALSGLSAILGHVYSVFLRFKGGKGVATSAGVLLVLVPIPLLFCLVLFVFIVYTTKFVSLGSMLAAGSFLVIELLSQVIFSFNNLPRLLLVALVVLLIFIKHRSNLQRLMAGTENKISFRSKFGNM